MKLITSTTSPFARIVRILLKEKNLSYEEIMVDPWSNPEELLEASPACKVPVLIDASHPPISGSLFIAQFLEQAYPDVALPQVLASELSQTALAFSLIEAFAAIIIGRRSLEDFDHCPVGLRRRDTLVQGLIRLNIDPPSLQAGAPSMACIVTVVLIDAIRFRFADASWIPHIESLDRLSIELSTRPSFAATQPK